MNSILDLYQKQVHQDRMNETYDISDPDDDVHMTKDEYERYIQTVDNLREQMYENIPKETNTRVESKTYPKSILKSEQVGDSGQELANEKIDGHEGMKDENSDFHSKGEFNMETLHTTIEELGCIDPSVNKKRFVIIHAKCPFCGEEILSTIPTMYNPFNFKACTPYKCGHCGSQYHNDYSYPFIALIDENNKIIRNNF